MSGGTVGRGKQKVLAGILGILIGWTGAHHYYLGSITSGLIVLGLTIVTCGLGSILSLVEGIMLLIMPDPEFDARYNNRTPESMEFVFMKPKNVNLS